ncbi:hypothetical protein D3C71_1162640 [compost metagenome]
MGGQAAQQTQGERYARIGRQQRMTGNEDQPQQVVTDVIHMILRIRAHDVILLLVQHLGLPLCMQTPLPQAVDGAPLCGGHQPGGGVVGEALRRPVFERGDQRVLGQLFSAVQVAQHACQARDQARRFHPPQRIEPLLEIGVFHQAAITPPRRCACKHRAHVSGAFVRSHALDTVRIPACSSPPASAAGSGRIHRSMKGLKPPQNIRLPSNGMFLASMPARRGSAIALVLTRSRCARER